MSVARGIVVGLACVALGGCPKKSTTVADAGASASASASAGAGAGASASAGADSGTGVKAGASFVGTYVVSAGTMYVPAEKDWASVKFKNDDRQLLGDGEMTVVIDASGRVSGGTDGGVLGASVLEGNRDGENVVATVRRKDPKDGGLTGTLLAKISGDKLEGSMRLAEFNAAVVRVASLTATKK